MKKQQSNLTFVRKRRGIWRMVESICLPYGSREPPPVPEVKELIEWDRIDVFFGCDTKIHHVSWKNTETRERSKCSWRNNVVKTPPSEHGSLETKSAGHYYLHWSTVFVTEGAPKNHRGRNTVRYVWTSVGKKIMFPREIHRTKIGRATKSNSYCKTTMCLTIIRAQIKVAVEPFREPIKLAFEKNCQMQTQTATRKIVCWNYTSVNLRAQLKRAWNTVKTVTTIIVSSRQ